MEENQVLNVQNNENSRKSYFDGGVLGYLGWKIVGTVITAITFGICFPFAACWMYEWEAKHTVIDGRRLKFCGTAGGFFVTWLLCLVLSIITLGIYVFYVPIKLQKWREANTFFEDELTEYDSEQKLKFEKVSSFDGGFWQYFGWVLLGFIITVCTLGIGFPVAVKMIYSWQQRHKIYCKKRCIFDGTAAGLFGTWILYIFLTIITCGIFSLCIPVKIKSWIVKHTHLTESLEITEEENNFKPKLLPGIICLELLIFTSIEGCYGAIRWNIENNMPYTMLLPNILINIIYITFFVLMIFSKKEILKKISIVVSSGFVSDFLYEILNLITRHNFHGGVYLILTILGFFVVLFCFLSVLCKKEKVKKVFLVFYWIFSSFIIIHIIHIIGKTIPDLLYREYSIYSIIQYLCYPLIQILGLLTCFLCMIEKPAEIKNN